MILIVINWINDDSCGLNIVKQCHNVINHPFGKGLYHRFTVIWGTVYYCFNYIYAILHVRNHLNNFLLAIICK
jgi:hypothetical protein